MDKIIEKQLKSYENNLYNMPYSKKIKEYYKDLQIIENSYDSFEYFRIVLFEELIYKKIDNKNELQIAFRKVRDALKFLSNQIKLVFPKEFIHLKDDSIPDSYKLDRVLRVKFKIKIKANYRVDSYISLIERIERIIDSVDYIYLNNKTLSNVDEAEGLVLTTNYETNHTLSFDNVIYNIKQRIKELFKLYE